MIVAKNGAHPKLTIALSYTATAFEEVRIENESAIQNEKTGAAPSSCVKSRAT